MSRPGAFDVEEPGPLLAELLRSLPASLVTRGAGNRLESMVLPMLYDTAAGPLGVLTGHVARANPLVRAAHEGEALVIVNGPQGYITPSWYPSKREHGKVVPTWDYVAVQAHGPLVFHDDPAWLLSHVKALTRRHESARPVPWDVADAPADYVAAMLRRIVGIEMPVSRLSAKAKLSQNRSRADVDGVIAGLQAEGDRPSTELADAVFRANAPPPART